MTERSPALGVIELANESIKHQGFLGSPETFDFPVVRASAEGAWTERVLGGDPTLVPAYAAAAETLVARGAGVLVANCGYAILYQDALTARLPVPIATSALLFLPLALRMIPAGRRLGVLSADSRLLTRAHLLAAGIDERDLERLVVGGLEGTAYAAATLDPTPVVDMAQLESDVLGIVEAMVDRDPTIGAFVFECTALGSVAPRVREATGLPIFDVLLLARLVADAVGVRGPEGAPAPASAPVHVTEARGPALGRDATP